MLKLDTLPAALTIIVKCLLTHFPYRASVMMSAMCMGIAAVT